MGVIGAVYPHQATKDAPAAKRQWIAEVAEYYPFAQTVPFRLDDIYVETGTTAVARNYWGCGVRSIAEDNFKKIVQLGQIPSVLHKLEEPTEPYYVPVSLQESSDLLLVSAKHADPSAGTGSRYSKRAKEIGDKAEKLALQWIRNIYTSESAREKIIWHAGIGETPGYDIGDKNPGAKINAYEVKGTTGPGFVSIELTANELEAAKVLRGRYAIVLIARVESDCPLIQIVSDPWGRLLSEQLTQEPTAYRIYLNGKK
jgi:hypothetical protein